MKANRFLFALGVAGLMLGTAGAVLADHDRAYELRQRGEILPLATFIERANRIRPGELVEAHLEKEDGRLLYEIGIYGDDNRYHELYFDARTGELVEDTEETEHAHPAGGG